MYFNVKIMIKMFLDYDSGIINYGWKIFLFFV